MGGSQLFSEKNFINYDNHSIFIVGKPSKSWKGGDLFASNKDFGKIGSILMMVNYSNKALRGQIRWSGSDYSIAATPNSVPFQVEPLIYEQTFGDSLINVYLNGFFYGETKIGEPYIAELDSVYLGGRTGFLSSGECFGGEISEVLIYERKLSSVERISIENYLKQKWLPNATLERIPPVTDGLRLNLDANCTDLIRTNESGRVTEWKDPIGNISLTQGNDLRRPLYCEKGANGFQHPSISFNGTNQLGTIEKFMDYSHHAIFIVAKTDPLWGGGDIFSSSGNFGAVGDYVLMANWACHASRGIIRWGTEGLDFSYTDTCSKSQFRPLIYQTDFDGETFSIELSGRREASFSIQQAYQSNMSSADLGGRSTSLGMGQCFCGDIFEVIIYDRKLTPQENNEVICYLNEKWRLDPYMDYPLSPVTRGLRLQCDASAKDSLSLDDRGRVISWNNLVELEESFHQVKENWRPVYQTVGFKDHPALSFNGSNVLGSDSFLNYSNHTVFVVAKAEPVDGDHDLIGSNGVQDGDVLIMNRVGESADYQGSYFMQNENKQVQHHKVRMMGASVTTRSIYAQRMDDQRLKLYRDGQLLGSSNVIPPLRPASLRGVTVGYRSNVDPSGKGFVGEVAEILVYDCALTDAERQQIEEYLYVKWIRERISTIIYLR